MMTLQLNHSQIDTLLYLLVRRLAEVKQIRELLRITRERDLTRQERWLLPGQLQLLTREELQEQIDPWISMEQHIYFLIEDLEKGKQDGEE